MIEDYLKSCPVCNADVFDDLKGFESKNLCKCKVCSFVFDKRKPTDEELHEHYKVYAYSALKPISPETIKSYYRLLDEFEQYRDTGNILDIGCGQGDFLVEAKKRGWNVFGVEYSEAAVELCKSRDIEMRQGIISKDVFADICFDVITSFEVIEHINTPKEMMEAVSEKLNKDGLFYCTTPNFNALLRYLEKDSFKMIVYPEHISFYTKKSLRFLGNVHQFKALKVLTTGIDIGRLKAVLKPKQKDITMSTQEMRVSNENIRDLVGSNRFMGLIKGIINFFLTLFGKGDTLKIYWVKNKERVKGSKRC